MEINKEMFVFMVFNKDTNRKIRKTEFIYICGSKNGYTISACSKHRRTTATAVHFLLGIWNQNCSYLSISVLSIRGGRMGELALFVFV